jgi:hypothetical protein
MMKALLRYAGLFVGRQSDFARQRTDGGYRRVGRTLNEQDIQDHLDGHCTLGSYVIDETGVCRFAVFDADQPNGVEVLHRLQVQLARLGIHSYMECSRRGGHLWVFFTVPALASRVRAWLLPLCPDGVEFYPKQAEGAGYGSLIRLPLGVHLRSGKRYPFIEWTERNPAPVARSVPDTLEWFTTIKRVDVPPNVPAKPHTPQQKKTSFSKTSLSATNVSSLTIREWCAQQDPVSFIGSYVDLNGQGIGCCPFSWHHIDGGDTRPSFKVYEPGAPGGYCWYCYVWQQGGSTFDFLRYWHNLDAREMWKRLQAESKVTQ